MCQSHVTTVTCRLNFKVQTPLPVSTTMTTLLLKTSNRLQDVVDDDNDMNGFGGARTAKGQQVYKVCPFCSFTMIPDTPPYLHSCQLPAAPQPPVSHSPLLPQPAHTCQEQKTCLHGCVFCFWQPFSCPVDQNTKNLTSCQVFGVW